MTNYYDDEGDLATRTSNYDTAGGDWNPDPISRRRGDFNLGPFNFGGGYAEESQPSALGRLVRQNAQPYTHTQMDPDALRAQQGAMAAIGQSAFGGPERGSEQSREAAAVTPYDAQHGQLTRTGAAGGVSMGDALTTGGQAQIQGLTHQQQQTDAEAGRRQQAQTAYGGAAGQVRGQQAQNAEFNATQQGNVNSDLYSMLLGYGRKQQGREDASNAQGVQSAEQIGSAALSLIALACDERIKTSIEPGDVAADRFMQALVPRVYRYRDDPAGVVRLGVMAQDVEEEHPFLVREINGVKHLDVPMLVASLAATIGRLHERLRVLEGK